MRVAVAQVVPKVASALDVCVPSWVLDCLSWLGGDSVVASDVELAGVT